MGALPDRELVLMLLTHPYRGMENFLTTMRCLERHTDLAAFDHIYLCANASLGEHLHLVQKYARRFKNIHEVHCSPPGHNPCVAHMQNLVHEKHRNDVILKMDDDIFVTPGWLPRLLETWKRHEADERVGLVAPVVPINTMGLKCLVPFFAARYGDAFLDLLVRGPHLADNAELHAFIWDKVLTDHAVERYLAADPAPEHRTSGPGSHVSINCVLYDRRLIDRVYPYNLPDEWFDDGEKKFDESIANRLFRSGELDIVVDTRTVVHHYAFNRIYEYLSQRHSHHEVYKHVFGLVDREQHLRSAI